MIRIIRAHADKLMTGSRGGRLLFQAKPDADLELVKMGKRRLS